MRTVTALSIFLLLASALPAQAAPVSDTRLEGRVLGFDGRPADGYRVHLIDGTGENALGADVGPDGAYRMDGVEAGHYSLALQTPDGLYAPIDGPDVKVREGHLVRRDLKLVERDPSRPRGYEQASTRFGTWWAGLDGGARAWTIAAIVVVAGISYEALSDDEAASSEILPPG